MKWIFILFWSLELFFFLFFLYFLFLCLFTLLIVLLSSPSIFCSSIRIVFRMFLKKLGLFLFILLFVLLISETIRFLLLRSHFFPLLRSDGSCSSNTDSLMLIFNLMLNLLQIEDKGIWWWLGFSDNLILFFLPLLLRFLWRLCSFRWRMNWLFQWGWVFINRLWWFFKGRRVLRRQGLWESLCTDFMKV